MLDPALDSVLVWPKGADQPTPQRLDRSASGRSVSFGGIELYPELRLVFVSGRVLSAGSRGFDLLRVLLQHGGAVVSKSDLMNGVWPDLTVEETNLRFQIAQLRRALGPDAHRIKNIPGRGYMLTYA